jgi:hypothetical protein
MMGCWETLIAFGPLPPFGPFLEPDKNARTKLKTPMNLNKKPGEKARSN